MDEKLENKDSVKEETGAGWGRSDLAELVLSLTHDLLEHDDVTLEDDFFSAGGDSMVAMYLIGQLAHRTGLRLRVSLIFANPTLGELVDAIDQLSDHAA